MNKLCAIGRLGADPDSKTTRGGTTVLELRIAIDARTKRGDEWVTLTTWCRASLFGRRAESLADKVRKGDRVGVSGALSVREFEKSDGTKGYSVEILDADITLLGSGGERAPRERRREESRDDGFPADDFADDDIPF
ncbi:MAG: single-stranded DNA-binding protein [Gemmatimonadaceae bacterium]|jgi:single-strand DNA-binding protein|nr:single-stranded DNA-binding protein [Gemmatimonadaceae bacterium]